MMNAKKLPMSGGSDKKRPDPLDSGSYPARLVQIVGLGVQPQREFKGETKPPRLSVRLTYEFLDEFMKDEEGNDLEDKPRWLSEELPFMSLKADLAKSTKRYFALDPEDTADGDWSKLVGAPCVVTVVQEADKRPGVDRIYEKVANVSSMRPKEAAKAPELKNPPLVWDFYDPDVGVFNDFPEWLREKIKGAVDYPGSALEKALGGGVAPKVDKGSQKEMKASKAPVDEPEGDDGDW
jgi:hypothetical protein